MRITSVWLRPLQMKYLPQTAPSSVSISSPTLTSYTSVPIHDLRIHLIICYKLLIHYLVVNQFSYAAVPTQMDCRVIVQHVLQQPGGVNNLYEKLYSLGYRKMATKLSETYYVDIADKLRGITPDLSGKVRRCLSFYSEFNSPFVTAYSQLYASWMLKCNEDYEQVYNSLDLHQPPTLQSPQLVKHMVLIMALWTCMMHPHLCRHFGTR